MTNPTVDGLFGVAQVTVDSDMVDTCMAGDINLATRIKNAGTRFTALNPESDDYADDLAELRAEFSGPVMDAIFEESLARRTASKASSDYDEGSDIFLSDEEENLRWRETWIVPCPRSNGGRRTLTQTTFSYSQRWGRLCMTTMYATYPMNNAGEITGVTIRT